MFNCAIKEKREKNNRTHNLPKIRYLRINRNAKTIFHNIRAKKKNMEHNSILNQIKALH